MLALCARSRVEASALRVGGSAGRGAAGPVKHGVCAELMLEGSLIGNAVHCSRLDRVKVCPGKLPDMDLL